MTTRTITVPRLDDQAEPAWEVALLLPPQGAWSEDDYLWVTDHTRHLVELSDGHLEVLPMPTDEHQRIVLFVYRTLYAFLAAHGSGLVLVAPLRLRLRTGQFREPDVLMLLSATDARRSNRFWNGADLVVEVVSPDDPAHDLVKKRQEYASAGILEYWIVDPMARHIRVLQLVGSTYQEHGVFERGMLATSVLLPGFAMAVEAVLDAV